jgi:hypothetical protein
MKGGTYQVITEADGTKRFSDGSDVRNGAAHNENGARDVQLIRSLHPDQDDNDIIQDSIGHDNTYGWLRNLSDKSKLSSEETPVEKQFRSLNTEQQNHAIAATKDAINTRLNDSKFPFKWLSSDSEEYQRARTSGIRNIQRWKLKDDYSGSGDVDAAPGHKLAIEQLHKTLGNFKSIQSDITDEQERQEEERRRQKREKMLQASQAAAKEAEKHRQGIQEFGREIKRDFGKPLSNIWDNQKALAGLTKKQKFPRAQLRLQIHAKKMEVKRYHDGLQSNTKGKHNLTADQMKEVFEANIEGLSLEHKDLHNEIIGTTTKQFENRKKELEGNLAELAATAKSEAKKAKKVVEEGAVMKKAAAASAAAASTAAASTAAASTSAPKKKNNNEAD